MKSARSYNWLPLGLSPYALALLALLLYPRFPGEELRAYGEARVAALFPGSSCRISGVSYDFPLTLGFAALRLDLGGSEERRVQAQKVVISLGSIFPPHRWAVSGTLYGGSLTGELALGADGEIAVTALRLRDLDLAALPLGLFGGRQLTGRLAGDGEGKVAAARGGLVGRGRLTVDNGRIALRQPIFSLENWRFRELFCVLAVDESILELRQGRLEGPELSADFSGQVSLARTGDGGAVQVRGRLRPQPALLEALSEQDRLVETALRQGDGGIGFEITGTIATPVLRLAP